MILVPSDAFTVSEREIALRLGLLKGTASAKDSPLRESMNGAGDFLGLPVGAALSELRRAVQCAYTFRESDVCVFPDGETCTFGFGAVRSRSLANYLDGAEGVYVFAATLGIGADRLIRSAGCRGVLAQYVTDAVASAMIESLCDFAAAELPLLTRSRFSPGYGDLPLEVQPMLLGFLGADRELGIRLSESFLMTPTKSVSAIIRIEKKD